MKPSLQHPLIKNNILSTVGHTPLISLSRLFPEVEVDLFGKFESLNPAGSIKDRTALQLISHAMETGELQQGDTVIESSSGNMAIGLAQACIFNHLKLIVVVDPNINLSTVKILKAYGARIEQVSEPAEEGGYLEARLQRVHALLEETENSFWPNQYKNPQNPIAHYQTMHEISMALHGQLDYLFVATSTCGTLMGCAEYIKEHALPTKLVAVDAVGSVIFGGEPKKRLLQGHGAGKPSQFLDKSVVHDVIKVDDKECVEGCRELLNREAMFCGGSSGGVVSACKKYLPSLPKGSRCALLLGDRGERYLDTIYNPEWVAKHITCQPS
ncbi:2,3-diaminopropionate biosynthesis protein SbnA [Kiritimatiellaeota bacterium B1221]|nr:2,3-diaminopropionate biosynthesis protein SbnA [Kiritimatiellaeota bacterium B1221]